MNCKQLHLRAIEILEQIEFCERIIADKEKFLKVIPPELTGVIKKTRRDIVTGHQVITRLKERYQKIIKQL